jgi:hypothetical protein
MGFSLKLETGEPRYPRSFYLRIRLFTFQELVLNAKFPVKFVFLSANNEAYLYVKMSASKLRKLGQFFLLNVCLQRPKENKI